MPNRIIKESICYSEDVNNLTDAEEVFFYRLLVNCDDYGRIDARVPILKSKLYPLRNRVKSSDIIRYLKKLSEIQPDPLVILYDNDGIRYLQITKWEKHQQIRAKRSKYPAIDDINSVVISHDINGNHMIAYVPENPNPNPNPNPNRESESEKEQQFFNSSDLNSVFKKYIEFRKDIKCPMTDYAVDLAVKKLNKECQTNDQRIETINQSILNGWKGLFPEKNKSSPSTAPQAKNFDQRKPDQKVMDNIFENGDST